MMASTVKNDIACLRNWEIGGGEIRETNTRISYIAGLKAATICSKQKLSTWLSFSPHQLVVANKDRFYFEQQILALLLVHQTHNLSRVKFAHISQLRFCAFLEVVPKLTT